MNPLHYLVVREKIKFQDTNQEGTLNEDLFHLIGDNDPRMVFTIALPNCISRVTKK